MAFQNEIINSSIHGVPFIKLPDKAYVIVTQAIVFLTIVMGVDVAGSINFLKEVSFETLHAAHYMDKT